MKASSNSQDRTGLQSKINTSNDVKKTQYIKVFKAAYDPTLTKIFFYRNQEHIQRKSSTEIYMFNACWIFYWNKEKVDRLRKKI